MTPYTEKLIANIRSAIDNDPEKRSIRAIERAAEISTGQLNRLLAGKIQNPLPAYIERLERVLDAKLDPMHAASPQIPTGPDIAGDDDQPNSQTLRTFVSLGELTEIYNVRSGDIFSYNIDELAQSIAANGIMHNLVVRPCEGSDGFEIIDGHRRFAALLKLQSRGAWDRDWRRIPIRVVVGDTAHSRKLALVANLQREDLTPLDEARAFVELRDQFGVKTAEIASAISKTPRYVQQRMALVEKLEPETQADLADGNITIAQARALTGTDKATQRKARRKIRDHAQHGQTVRPEAIAGLVTRDLIPVEKAIFDVDKSGLEITERDLGGDAPARFFTDRDAFRGRQRAAGEALAKKLGKDRAWSKFTTEHFPTYRYEKSDAPGPEHGVVVVYDDFRMEITVHDGLTETEATTTHDEREREAKEQEARIDAFGKDLKAFETAMRDALQTRPDLVQRLLLFDSLCSGSPLQIEQVSHHWLRNDAKAVFIEHGLGLDDSAWEALEPLDVWGLLCKRRDGEINDAWIRITAATYTSSGHKYSLTPIGSLDCSLALALDVEIPPSILGDDADGGDGDIAVEATAATDVAVAAAPATSIDPNQGAD